MRVRFAGSAGVSPAMGAKREEFDAPDGAFADGTSALPAIADLLEYPTTDWDSIIVACAELLSASDPEILKTFTTFRQRVHKLSLSELQELYTRTFDLNPVCALEIGYHLFGENYKRGEFLAHLRETEAPFDLDQERQLPDYLPVLLRLLTRLNDEELRAALIRQCLLPALARMLKAFGEGENPYRHLIETVQGALRPESGAASGELADRPSVRRASLPILTSDPRNCTNSREITQTDESVMRGPRVASCGFVDRTAFGLETNPDLF